MLEGRIDTHGTVKELNSRGVLEEIAHDEQAQGVDEPKVILAEDLADAAEEQKSSDRGAAAAEQGADKRHAKTPKKLVEKEARATGSVKWPIYKVYLKAS
jgi:sorbitol-specific phosphotransferase system component IIBC